ncbi:hypothetical protein ACFFIX_19765 [Metabacillus herbersteinensis]|uniref:Lipoprotein n=1 Tax=Metabacillus herbersteinensis TaxID=283816 RepID=A0ABV6GIW8_9BACI
MIKRFLILLTISSVLVGCSSEKKEKGPGLGNRNQPKEEEASLSSVEQLDKILQNSIKESNVLLSQFNKSLDGFYTGNTSNSQFATVVSGIVNDSHELVSSVEKEDVDPTVFELQQKLVAHLNQQHGLFLNAVDMANQEKVNKDTLRNTYLEIKQEQAAIMNGWNNS